MKRSDGPPDGFRAVDLLLLIISESFGRLSLGICGRIPRLFFFHLRSLSILIRCPLARMWAFLALPFKTRHNEFFYHLSSFMTLREAYLWLEPRPPSHRHHHCHGDPEIQVMPADPAQNIADFFDLGSGPRK